MKGTAMILYRCESAYGSGIRNIVDIIEHEMFELCNTDIPYYLTSEYWYMFSDETFHILLSMNGDICDNDEIEDEHEVACRIVKEINDYTGKNYQYALWLASKTTVENLYADPDSVIDAYETSDMILSDLGYDGTLYAYETMPTPIT